MFQKFKDPKAVAFITSAFAVFIGTVIALSWNNIFKALIDLLMEKMPGASIIAAIGSAIVVTIVGIVLAITVLSKLGTPEKQETPEPAPAPTPAQPPAPATQPPQPEQK